MIIGKLQLVDNIKREIPDNSTGQVSPRDVRQNMINIIDSVHMLTADHDLNFLNVSTPDTRTTRAGQETLSKLHLQGYSSEDNSAFGYSALSDNYDGTKNTAIGSYSMGCNLYGDSNTAIGFSSLAGNVFGSGNVAVGNFALQRSKFGSFNVAIGHGAGYYVGSHDKYKLYIGSHNLEDTCDNPLGSGLVPLMYGDMQNLRLGVATAGLHNYGALQVSGDISPSQDCQDNLGHSSYRWNDLYLCNSINESVYFSGEYVGFGANPPSGQGLVTIAGHLVPSLHNTYALGHPDLRWDGYFNDITVSGTANIENAIYTNIEDCTYHCRTLYLASSGLCDDMGGWAPPCGYLHDEQIEGGGFVLQSSGVDFRRNYEFTFTAPDTTLTCLEEDTPYARSAWNSNISIHVAAGSHVKTDRTIGRDNLSLLSENCCYGIFMKKDTDGIREDRTGINEIQAIAINATGGTFTLTFDGQTTAVPIAYNASAQTVQSSLEGLTTIGDDNVYVATNSNGFEIRFQGDLGGKNVSQITCNGDELTKTEKAEVDSTKDYPGVDEIQKIIIRADAGEWRLGHPDRSISGECGPAEKNEALGGYFTNPLRYDIDDDELQTIMQDCFSGMLDEDGSSNISVSLAISGNTRTYTITFINKLKETMVNPWLVDRYSLMLGDEDCNSEEQNEIIKINLDHATDGTFNILTYLSQSDYDNNCPFYRTSDIPFNATKEELDLLLTATCEGGGGGGGDGWGQMGADIDGEAASDQSGTSVSLSSDGNVLAVGEPGAINKGQVRVWYWNVDTWTPRGVAIEGEAVNDLSGSSVSLSSDGDVVAIGAPDNLGTHIGDDDPYGHVRVYYWNDSAWVQRGDDIDGEGNTDKSGSSVSLSSDGTIVAIGAIGNSDGGTDAGQVRVFEWSGSAWGKIGDAIEGEAAGEQSGFSVSLSSDGNIVAIGATGSDVGGTDAGHVRVYYLDDGAWAKRGNDIEGEAAGEQSGSSVSLSSDGSIVAIGATGSDSGGTDAGHVRVYAWSGSAWVKRGEDIDGKAAGDYSGYSVSLSSDGTIVAIGATGSDSGGTDAGHVLVYVWNGTTWEQSGADIDGEAVGDYSGFSVSLSSDGSIVAIGAPRNDGIGSNAGHVRVYDGSLSSGGSGGGGSSGGCGWMNKNHPACGVPEWIAGSNQNVAYIDNGDWIVADLHTGAGTDDQRIQVRGVAGDWEIEFGNTAFSSSFFNGKNIAPMRIDSAKLIGGVSSNTPEFTVVRTHQPIENAYNKITVNMTKYTAEDKASIKANVSKFKVGFTTNHFYHDPRHRGQFSRPPGAQSVTSTYYTATLDQSATIAEVIKAMNKAVASENADFFIPYISPQMVANDPVYGDHLGYNKFWQKTDNDISQGDQVTAADGIHGNNVFGFNSRLDTDSTFLGTLEGEHIDGGCGWAIDGMLGKDLGEDFYDSNPNAAGSVLSFDILTHTGWSHIKGTANKMTYNSFFSRWQDTQLADEDFPSLVAQYTNVTNMWLEGVPVGNLTPKQKAKVETYLDDFISFGVASPISTSRTRRCLYDEEFMYDVEWDSSQTASTHTVDSNSNLAALGDGIVGRQGDWTLDELPQVGFPQVATQSSGPTFGNENFRSTSWSWFDGKIV